MWGCAPSDGEDCRTPAPDTNYVSYTAMIINTHMKCSLREAFRGWAPSTLEALGRNQTETKLFSLRLGRRQCASWLTSWLQADLRASQGRRVGGCSPHSLHTASRARYSMGGRGQWVSRCLEKWSKIHMKTREPMWERLSHSEKTPRPCVHAHGIAELLGEHRQLRVKQ